MSYNTGQEVNTMNNRINTIGERIRFYRKSKGLTQKQLADLSGISKNHISAIESGWLFKQNRCIGVKTLEALTKALNIESNSFFDEIRQPYDDYNNENALVKQSLIEEELYGLDVLQVFYPPMLASKLNRESRVTTLLELLIYLPLIDQGDLLDCLIRISGDIAKREIYVSDKLAYLVKNVPEKTKKKYADYISSRIKLQRTNHSIYAFADSDVKEELIKCYQEYNMFLIKKQQEYEIIHMLKQK